VTDQPDAKEDIPFLLKELGNDDPVRRDRAEARLLEIGERAEDQLKKAENGGDAEVRDRVARILKEIHGRRNLRRNELDCISDLSAKERALLDGFVAYDSRSGEKVPLSMSIRWARERIDQPESAFIEKPGDWGGSVWALIDSSILKDATVHKGSAPDAGYDLWLLKAQGNALLATRPTPAKGRAGVPRFYLLKLKTGLDLGGENLKWDPKEHMIPTLKGVVRKEGWSHLYLGEHKRTEGGALYAFNWDQDQPFPSLRAVFVKEKWLILCVAYQ
jgi:hypothetical protein